MVRDCSIAPKRDNLVDGDQVNWGGGHLSLVIKSVQFDFSQSSVMRDA